MKKHRYTAAAVMLSLSMLTGTAAADYSDLKPHWAEQAMEFAVQSNLTQCLPFRMSRRTRPS